MKQQTKAQLIMENALLKTQIAAMKEASGSFGHTADVEDERIRDRLCFVLGLSTTKSDKWGGETKINRPWEEIFCEVGKLLERKRQTDLEADVGSIRNELGCLRERIHQLDPKDSPF